MKTVDDLKPGESGTIKKFNMKGNLGKHLREMGVIKGTPIKFERQAPLGYPLQIKLLGFSLAIRQEEAESIILE